MWKFTRKEYLVHISLFVITLFTTTVAGVMQQGIDIIRHPFLIYKGLPFSLTLLTILGIHELGHYISSKKNGIQTTLPFFLPAPAPFSLLGTFGAFIKMKSIFPNRNTLLKVGAWGPIAGFIIAVPAIIIGLRLSNVGKLTPSEEGLELGSSLLFYVLSKITLGVSSSEANIYLHPIAFAGWIGLLVTALNLLPVGQLDGGHIVYAFLGQKYHALISKITFVILIFLSLFWYGWFVWVLITFFLGFRHPPLLEEMEPLDNNHRYIAIFAIVIFFICFVPIPFKIG